MQPLHTVTPDTHLADALHLLLETGVSALPVVDDKRCLLDLYARADITKLCQNNLYKHLQWEDVTVRGQCWGSSAVHGGVVGRQGNLKAVHKGEEKFFLAAASMTLHKVKGSEERGWGWCGFASFVVDGL